MQLIQSFQQGGSERQAVQLTRLLHESGRYHIHVACLRRNGLLLDEVEQLDLPPILEFPLVSFYHPSTLARLRQFASTLTALNIDVVQAHDFSTTIFGMAGAALGRTPVRIAARRETDPDRTRLQRWIERRAFDLAHAVVVNANAIGHDLIGHGVPRRKLHTIHNGVDLRRFGAPMNAARADILESFGLPLSRHRLFVTILANLWLTVKDHPTFLRAARHVRAAVPDAAFIIAGEGVLVEPMRRLARDLGLADDVFFLGRCQRVPELLSISDVCVLSSVSEGFPNVIVEYMAAGRPVVATDVGGASEAVIHGETGWLVAAGDDRGMASHIISLLRDQKGREAMGARGRIAAQKFSCDAQLDRTLALYERLLHSRPHTIATKTDFRPARRQADEVVP